MDPNVRWLGFGAVVRAGGMTLVAPYVVLYLRNVLHLGYAEIGLLVALTGVVPLLIVPFAGLLTDRIGRRRVFLVALVAEALAVLFVAAAMQERWLLGMVVSTSLVYTVGTIAGPALSAYVADFSVGSERTLAFTWVRIGWNVGFTLGVLAGGSLIGFIGFPDVGFLAGAVLLVSTTFLAVVLRPSPYDLARGAARQLPAADRPPTASFRESARVLMRDRVFLAFCAAVAVAQLSITQWGWTFPLYANAVLGIPYSLIGVGLAINGLLVVFVQAPITKAGIGHRHTSLFVLGTALYAGGFLVLAGFAFAGVAIVAGFFLSIVVLTTGENLTSIPANTLPSNLAPPTEVGAYNGAFFAIVGAGQLLAQPLGGFVLALGANPLLTWGILVVPALPAMLWLGGFIAPRVDPRANRA
ncbi:MAG: MFS transporter [Thermoplasmata archaeon]